MDPGAQEILQIILEKLGGLESRIAHQDEILRGFQTSANSSMAELQDVIMFAREKRAHISEQAKKQRLFMDVLNLVAKNGFLSEVREVFSLNRTVWNDIRFWEVIVNRKHKFKLKYKGGNIDGYEQRVYFWKTAAERTLEYEETRLCMQCRFGKESSVYRLLRLGSNVNITNLRGGTALTVASCMGRKKLVKALLDAGALVNHTDMHGNSSLTLAAARGHAEVVDILLRAGAFVNHTCVRDGYSALSHACAEGFSVIVDKLIHVGADVNSSDKRGCSPLSLACNHGHVGIIRTLLKANAMIQHEDNKGRTALFEAADNEEVLSILLEAGAVASHESKDGSTALFVACQMVCIPSVKLLLKAGLVFSHFDEDGNSPLIDACSSWDDEDNPDFILMLLEAGAAAVVNHENAKGETALTEACTMDKPEVVKLLLQFGAVVNHVTAPPQPTISWKAGSESSLTLAVGSLFHDFGHEDQASLLRILLQAGALVNHANSKGETALSQAATFALTTCAELLLEAGADANHIQNGGWSVLDLALDNGDEEMIQLIRDHLPQLNEGEEEEPE